MTMQDKEGLRVVDGAHRAAAIQEALRVLPEYDATVHVGLRTVICDAVIERVDADGETTIEVAKPEELRAAAAVLRCLTPIRLRGSEMKAIRKILGLTLAEMAKRMDDRTAPETVSRWESEAQPMGGYAEKMLRLLICEELKEKAPGIAYNAKMISDLRVLDPWRMDENYPVPTLSLRLIEMKEQSGTIIETYNAKRAA